MKTSNFLMAFAAIATVSMSSCSQEEELVMPNSQLSDNAVVFGTYIGASRASVIDTDALKANGSTGFGVLAYYTGQNNFGAQGASQTPNFMYNQQVTWSADPVTAVEGDATDSSATEPSGSWTYSPLKYWPNNSGDKISFFAYAPYTDTPITATYGITALSANNAAGDPTLTFKMTENVANQVDLLYATAVKDQTKSSANQKVSLNFKHALSRVTFSRQLVVDNDALLASETKVTINSVKFSAMKFGKVGTLNLNTGAWAVTETADNASYVLDSNKIKNNVIQGGEESTKEEPLTNDGGNIMFIPVNMTDQGSQATSTITINYTVETTDSKLFDGFSTITNEKTVNVNSINFEAGKNYKFILKIGLTSVELAAQVSDWSNVENVTWETLFN